ncbi:protein kinase [Streptomyces sp. NPDC087440]|uniref:protein kinase domain-containing protein n=1 Tax=Streptomyces sp. NPDC087440 TaxID=3365790 RepID=UPI003827A21A
MDEYAGRVLADRYRLPLPPSDEYDLVETRAFDTYSGQEVLVRQVPLPEVVDAEFLDADGAPVHRRSVTGRGSPPRSTDPTVLRAVEAVQAVAQIPDHPRIDQVYDVFQEDGSLWIVSELVSARPLAALLAEAPLSPYRAAEVASDVLTALRVLHAHGWTHRNITVRTVLVCDDGRIVLTGLAAGAAEEALCGYAPIPGRAPADPGAQDGGWSDGAIPVPRGHVAPGEDDTAPQPALPALPTAFRSDEQAPEQDPRAARAGAIAAYRAGARAAVQATEEQRRQADPARSPYLQDQGRGPGPGPVEDQNGARPPASDYGAGTGPISPYGDPPDRPRMPAVSPLGQRPGAVSPYTDTIGRPTGPAPGAPSRAPGPSRAPEPSRTSEPSRTPESSRTTEVSRTSDASRTTTSGTGVERAGEAAPGAGWHGAVPRGGGGAGGEALRADDMRHGRPVPAQGGPHPARTQLPVPGQKSERTPKSGGGRWDDVIAGLPYRGPSTPLAAERARQTRINVVGAVTERWAPEQAGPVHVNWQLAPPIGPATDLWALGALLFRVVQGHAPYPEDNAAELVQMVCAEPPAFAEDCGPLRPVVESLLRQDPTERPDFEELRGWLRSLVRSAPEPEAGTKVVPVPSPPDATRLPIVRRRGELVRKRKGKGKNAANAGRHRHKQPKGAAKAAPARPPKAPRGPREPRIGAKQPRSLGRWLLILVLALLAAAVVYAVKFLPKDEGAANGQNTGSGQPAQSQEPEQPQQTPQPQQPAPAPTSANKPPKESGRASEPAPPPERTADSGLPNGFSLVKDPKGFEIAVGKDWRREAGSNGQVRYYNGDIEVVVVPGRDTVQKMGPDPMEYQLKSEPETQPLRDSTWAASEGLRSIGVGQQAGAEGQFKWRDRTTRWVFVRNRVMIFNEKYHVIQVIGPESQRDEVDRVYEAAAPHYRPTS